VSDERIPTAVLASGNGTNLQAVIDAVAAKALPLELRVVASNNERAPALERARRAGIATLVMPYRRDAQSRADYGLRLARELRSRGVRLVLLLGWMHVLAPEFLDAGFEAILNLHPGYLPDNPADDTVALPDGTRSKVFRGARALRDAIEERVTMTGATLMRITTEVDRGPVLARRTLELLPDDDERSALERLHPIEQQVVRDGILAWLESRVRR